MVLSIFVTADNPEYHPVLCRIGVDEFEAVGMRSHRRQGVLARWVEDIGGIGVTGPNKYKIGSLLIRRAEIAIADDGPIVVDMAFERARSHDDIQWSRVFFDIMAAGGKVDKTAT